MKPFFPTRVAACAAVAFTTSLLLGGCEPKPGDVPPPTPSMQTTPTTPPASTPATPGAASGTGSGGTGTGTGTSGTGTNQ